MKCLKKFIYNYINWTPNKSSRIVILFLPFFLFLIREFNPNNDFWFLLNIGREILKNGFITIEPFTIHSNLSFIPQQWLTSIIFYSIYNTMGLYGMYVFLMMMNVVIIYLLYKLLLLISNGKYKISVLLATSIDIIYINSFLTTRPFVFDIIIILSEIYILELFIKKKKNYYLYLLPIISFLMINFHASVWPMLFIIMIPYIIGKIKTNITYNETYKLKPIIIIAILMLIICFINPYGLDAMLYFFKSYNLSGISNYISEMQPTNIKDNIIIYLYILLILFSYYITGRKNKKINLRYFLLFLGTTYLGLLHKRGLVFTFMCGLPALADNFKEIIEERSEKKTTHATNIIYIIIVLCMVSYGVCNFSVVKEEDMAAYQIANYLDENTTKDIKLYTDYNEGGYYEYRGYKCYIDPRAEVFYKINNKEKDIMIEYLKLQYIKESPEEFLNKYNFDYLVVADYDVMFYYLELLGYEIKYEISDDNKRVKYRLFKSGEKNEKDI